ncbi:MAG: hypothetical protein KTR31_35960 [Myxococcales bacterium]|nr:hypothetical protein [Myxococcales bacterium]
MLWLLSASSWATCPSTTDDIRELVDASEVALIELDSNAFVAASDALHTSVACVAQPLSAPLIARLHRVQGLRAYVEGDAERATAAFSSARAAAPELELPATFVPEGHELTRLFLLQPVDFGGVLTWPQPDQGDLLVDGRSSLDVPVRRPSVLQLRLDDGHASTSLYHWPDTPPFQYPAERPRRRVRKGWLALSGLTAAASGGLLLASVSTHRAYLAEDHDPTRLDRLRLLTNATTAGAYGAGATGLTLGVVALLGRRK